MITRKFECCQNYLLQWLSSKESTCNAGARGDMCSIPGSRRSLGGGHGNPLQYSCLENPIDRDTWQATVHRLQSQSWAHWSNWAWHRDMKWAKSVGKNGTNGPAQCWASTNVQFVKKKKKKPKNRICEVNKAKHNKTTYACVSFHYMTFWK